MADHDSPTPRDPRVEEFGCYPGGIEHRGASFKGTGEAATNAGWRLLLDYEGQAHYVCPECALPDDDPSAKMLQCGIPGFGSYAAEVSSRG